MAMQLARKRRRGDPDIPVASFSDIAFLLIIFFILATTFVKTAGFQAELPQSKQDSSAKQEDIPVVKVVGERIFYGTGEVDLEGLKVRLAELRLAEKAEDKRFVSLEKEGTVRYELWYAVYAAIARHGGNVTLVEEEK